MHSSKTLERRAFLASTTALMANIGACNDDAAGGGTSTETSASTDPGSSGPDSTATNASTTQAGSTAANSSSSSQGTSSVSTSDPSDASSSSQSTTVEMSSSSQASSSSGGSSSTSDGSSSTDATSTEERPAQDACFEGGGTDAGMAQDAGGGVLCSTNTDNGDHCHPFVLPQSDIDEGFAEATYNLEDGGTGHTHTVTLSTYDVLYLQAGIPKEVVSSTEAGHNHVCLITCAS